jgi:PAS domain S-box-containing protein
MSSREQEKSDRIKRLRLQAETWLSQHQPTASSHALSDLQRLVHELQVHQAELEMQHEELLLSQSALEESRYEYVHLYEAAPIGYFTLNGKGLILKVNPVGNQLLGTDRSVLLNRLFRVFILPQERAAFDAFLAKATEAGSKQSGEFELMPKHGRRLVAQLEVHVITVGEKPLSDAVAVEMASTASRCLLAVVDVTARKEAEHKLRESQAALKAMNEQLERQVEERTQHLEAALQTLSQREAQLEAANRELKTSNLQLTATNADLDNFVYTASHDLKAPIVNIEALLTLLLDALPTETHQAPEVQQLTGYMHQSVQRFKTTLGDLTEIARLQRAAGQEAEQVSIGEVIEEVVQDMRLPFEQTAAQLTIETGNCPPIRFSRKNLRSIVYNLLSNALKYRSPERLPAILIQCQATPTHTLFLVRDNGLGIDQAKTDTIFNLFTRLHTHVEGTGIGLYMVRKIIHNAGGSIQVDSQPGVGSTFKVYFKQ